MVLSYCLGDDDGDIAGSALDDGDMPLSVW